jgi:hypothetical protein
MKRQKGNENEIGHSKDNKKTTNRSMPCSFIVLPNPPVNLCVI